jgi:putative ABC transport system permease protein
MFKIAFKSLLAHKLRMLLTAFAIVMGVAFVSGTYIFTDSIGNTFNNLFGNVYSGIDLSVRAQESEFSDDDRSFDESVAAQVQSLDGVKAVEPLAESYAQYIDSDGNPIGGGAAPVLGLTWSNEPELSVLRIKDGNGRSPEKSGEVVMDISTASNNNFSVGDTVAIQTLGPLEDFTIVGLASFGDVDGLAGATLAVFELNEAQRLFGLEDKLTLLNIKLEESADKEALKMQIAAIAGNDNEVVTGDQQTQEQQSDINEGLGFINTALLAFAGIGIFVGGFIIQNTFRIIVAQRSKELALLRAVGATRRQVVSIVVYEAIIIGLIASGVGILAGFLVANGISTLGNQAGLGLPEGDLSVLPRTIYVALAVGVGVTVASAIFPAIKASRVSPVEALSDNESNAPRRSLKKRSITSVIITSLGGGLLAYGLFADVGSPIYAVGFGVLTMFLGVSAFAPILSAPLANILGWPFAKLRGVSGRLAQENTKRTPRRTASTASALMIGVALVALVSIFAASVNATIEDVVAESFSADIVVTGQSFDDFSAISPLLSDELRQITEIDVLAQIKLEPVEILGDSTFIQAVNPLEFQQVIRLKPSENAFENLANDLGGAVVKQEYLNENDLVVGSSIEVNYGNEVVRTYTVVGSFMEANDSNVIVNRQAFDSARNIGISKDTYLAARYSLGTDAVQARESIDAVAKNYPTVQIQDQGELVRESKEQINSLLGLFWALLGFAIVIAVLGIANTLTLSIAERTREIGLLRAVGMTKRQVRSMVRAEAIIISLFGATLGIFMGTFFAWAILKALESDGLTSFVIPWNQIAAYYVLAAIAGIIASIWPAIIASRVSILSALDFE